jgi:plasmid stabilization system protein ParE
MKVIITNTAECQIAETSDYIEQAWGRVNKIKFRKKIQKAISLLRQNPNLGALEPLLKQHAKQYHSIVATQYNKIIYFVNDDHIEIVAFWDVRREPTKLANEIIDK